MKYGRYQVIREIGKGSMGVVYEAHDPNMDLKVALKVLRHDRVVSDAFVRRFLAEARALGRLDRANIVRIYNVDEDSDTVYIAMEFVEGESLDEVMRRKKFSPEEIIEMGVTIARTLDYAHQKGIVHRDIKPSNILIRSDGFLKITDFGIAHVHDPSSSEKTQAGEILGTPAYMSPEQVMSRKVDGRADLFSLGIILYEMSAGTRPFQGANMAAIFNAITHKEPVPLTKVNPSIPGELAKVIMKCLRKRHDERFPTGKALAEALRGCLKEKVASEIAVPGVREKPVKRVFLVAGILLLFVLAGGLSYHYFMNRGGGTLAPLQVQSAPEGAQVYIDGVFKGNTPIDLELHVGKHEVRMTMPNYYDWEAQVELTEEWKDPLSAELVPIDDKGFNR